MNKEEMEKIVNDIKDSLWNLENNGCNIDTKENGWETYYGLNDKLIKYIRKIEKENKQLKDNWNKLIEWVFGEKMMFYKGGDGSRLIRYYELCNKMQELGNGDSNE